MDLHHCEFPREETLRQLRLLLGILGNYASWLVAWCRAKLGKSLYPPRGFFLNYQELLCLGLDAAELQAQQMAGSPSDPIVAGTDCYGYRSFDKKEGIAKPSQSVPATHVIYIYFKAEVCAFPFQLISSALRVCCEKIGCKYEQLLIPHFDSPCEDLLCIVNSMMNQECETEVIAKNIARWRTMIEGFLLGLSSHFVQPVVQPVSFVVPTDSEIIHLFDADTLLSLKAHDQRLNRKVRLPIMLNIVKRSYKTLDRWEKAKRTPHGVMWLPPDKYNGIEYFLPAYLAPLQELLPILRAEDAARNENQRRLTSWTDSPSDE